MGKRTKRSDFLRPERELERLREGRHMLVAVRTRYPINSEAYHRAGEAMKAIDDLAEALVGDRGYLLNQHV